MSSYVSGLVAACRSPGIAAELRRGESDKVGGRVPGSEEIVGPDLLPRLGRQVYVCDMRLLGFEEGAEPSASVVYALLQHGVGVEDDIDLAVHQGDLFPIG